MTLLFILRIYSATLFLVLAAGYLLTSPRENLSRWFAALCLADFCYIILATALRQSVVPIDLGILIYPLAMGTILSASLFLICTWILTRDNWQIPHILIVAVVIQIAIEFFNMPCRESGLCLPGYNLSRGLGLWLQRIADLLELSIQLVGVFLIAYGANSDLVNARRRLRLYFLLPLFLTVTLLEFSPVWMASEAAQTQVYFVINSLVFAVITTLVLYLSLATNFQYFRQISPKPTTTEDSEKSDSDQKLSEDKERFQRIFVIGKAYLDAELTVARLAERLDIPQYRLRKLINEEFAYRNFNDLLNQYRVEEFCRKSKLPENEKLPVTSLALDSGFRSLTTFNDVFKRIMGMTPGQYRVK